MYNVKVVEHSSALNCKPIRTISARYPRFIHSEVLTHRVFSRNASSSRAIPVKKMLSQVWNDPATPIHWGANQAGMQAKAQLTGLKLWLGKKLWRGAGKLACSIVYVLDKLGAHKQWANRLLEPWQYITTIITSTEWDNFFELRRHEDAQPEFKQLADEIYLAILESEPKHYDSLNSTMPYQGWHLPYVTEEERNTKPLSQLLKFSAARCARVSYLTHEGDKPSPAKDVQLFDRLVGSVPLHASPIEHQGMMSSGVVSNNFRDWMQHRSAFEAGLKI